jgi:hypothetical protein
MKRILSLFAALICFSVSINAQGLKSPQEFLRTEYGKHFTPHYLVADYVRHVAANSDRVTLIEYGQTNEDRPLLLATITTKENQQNIGRIQNRHLNKIGLGNGTAETVDKDFAVVWLSFGVHGNEAGASESSMNVIYKMANPDNAETSKWLENSVVLFDPSINPDGYNRYTQWVRGIGGKTAHPGHTDREHMEPWPGGRVNHYLFDLNRDWAWQTQVESQQRVAQYAKWMPHIHVDFHEMGYDDGYYFAPAAEPYHKHITDFQRDMQVDIGKNHAKYFDKEGWLYFTREIFDLFYPSYGDTWPLFNGAIGMTHEQAGHGMSGRAISLSNGDTLTIQDRIDHHSQTALSTLEEASKQATRLNENFVKYFSDAVNSPKGTYKSYVIKASEKTRRLCGLLTKNNIKYYESGQGISANGYSYLENKSISFKLEKGDVIINANQPNGTLLQVFMEPEPILSDSVTYDITAWSLPHAYGVEAYGMKNYTTIDELEHTFEDIEICILNADDKYAITIPWESVNSAQSLAHLYKNGFNVRMAKKDVQFTEGVVSKGSIVVVRGDNYHIKNFAKTLEKALGTNDNVMCLKSGFSTNGGDIGSSAFARLSQPKALLISGKGTGANAVGQIWHYFDEVIGYPLSIVDKQDIGRVDYDDFNTLILPDGYYSFSEDEMKDITSFINDGGKVIAISGALGNFVEKEGYALAKYATDDEKDEAKKHREAKKLEARNDSFHDQERHGISNSVPGAIINNNIDTSHPLSFGLGESYHSLKTSRQRYSLLQGAWNVVSVPKDYKHYGFIGAGLKLKFEGTVSFAVEEKGSGSIIYMVDNTLFRGFWDNGLMLFGNALFLVD